MKRYVIGAILGACLGSLAGCADMSGLQKGGAIGAGAGAVLGNIIGGNTKGTVAGAIVGGIVGAVAGNYYDKKVASKEQAAQKYAGAPGTDKLVIENAALDPQTAAPGSTVDSSVQYTTLAANSNDAVSITETRTLVGDKESMQLAKREVVRPQGTHNSAMKFTLPKDVNSGDYTLVTTVSDRKQTQTTKTPLKVVLAQAQAATSTDAAPAVATPVPTAVPSPDAAPKPSSAVQSAACSEPVIQPGMSGKDAAMALGPAKEWDRHNAIVAMVNGGRVRIPLCAEEVAMILKGTHGDPRARSITVLAPTIKSGLSGPEAAAILGSTKETDDWHRHKAIAALANAKKFKLQLTGEELEMILDGTDGDPRARSIAEISAKR